MKPSREPLNVELLHQLDAGNDVEPDEVSKAIFGW